MSAGNPFFTANSEVQDALPVGDDSRWSRLESWLVRGSEKLNPILVKEARQALKSNQFAVTFTLLLICAWAWSLLGVTWLSPNMSIGPAGTEMLLGYVFILIVPLLIIVPFSAFRSLAAEREDGTFELLSITALSARQIVTGKMGSAVLQMLIYFSALSPCVAFTYLLRGVDVFMILLTLGYSLVISLMLSIFGLLMATITRARHWQVLLSVALILGLVWVTFLWGVTIGQISFFGLTGYDQSEFWIVMAAILSGCASFFVLFLYAAAGNISFASDNRSTRLRIVMLGQQVLWIGWMMYAWMRTGTNDLLGVALFFSGFYWGLAGALMTGESAQLSPRTKRSLPQSFLGRALFTWFNPGSGTGYMFAVTNMFCIVFLLNVAVVAAQVVGFGTTFTNMDMLWGGIMTWSYVTAYLGAGRLIFLLLRRAVPSSLLLAFLIHVVLNLVGCVFPPMIDSWIAGFNSIDYTELQATNWFWTLSEAWKGNIWNYPIVPILVCGSALILLAINLVLTAAEVEQVRQETPRRIVEDDLALHPERAPKPVRSSPWD